MKNRLSLLLFVLVLSFTSNAYSADTCPEALKAELLNSDFIFQSWQDLYAAFKRYSGCDDGALAEGYSDSIVKLLMNHWEKLDELNGLVKSNKRFRKFVLHHIDETMSPNDRDKIIDFSTHQCPSKDKELCLDITRKATDLKRKFDKTVSSQ